MSGLEIAIPVISAVFALVSAFKDGGAICEKIKERRLRKGVQLPNERLQRVLHQGVQEVEQHRAEGYEEFGDDFLKDPLIASRLKDVTIVLQDAIIKQLAAACNNDDMNDFGPVINSVVQARKEAVNILNKHYLEMQNKQQQGSTSKRQMAEASDPVSKGEPEHVKGKNSRDVAMTDQYAEPSSPTLARSRTGTWSFFPRRRSSIPFNAKAPLSPLDSNKGSPTSRSPEPPKAASPPTPQSPFQVAKVPSPRIERSSTSASILSPLVAGNTTFTISESNNYGGLCKGAYHAQKLNLRKAMEPSMREYEWMYHCHKCKFRLKADPSQRGNPHFDDRMQVAETGPIYFRFLFLWKSHIGTKDGIRRYHCLLCTLGGGTSNVYKGEDQLFAHLTRHENGFLGDCQISGPLEVNHDGLIPSSVESFDLYFPRDKGSTGPGFMLPDSAVPTHESTQDPSLPSQHFTDDPYENVWRRDASQ